LRVGPSAAAAAFWRESNWRMPPERGGDMSDMARRDWVQAVAMLTTTLGIVFVLIIAALAALVWLVIKGICSTLS
jgi:hypothetical protein